MDATLKEIFEAEAREHIDCIEAFLQACDVEAGCAVSNELLRALHTLAGSAHMAECGPIARIAKASERYFEIMQGYAIPVREEEADLLVTTAEMVRAILDVINAQGAQLPDWHGHLDDVQAKLVRLEAEATQGMSTLFADSRLEPDDLPAPPTPRAKPGPQPEPELTPQPQPQPEPEAEPAAAPGPEVTTQARPGAEDEDESISEDPFFEAARAAVPQVEEEDDDEPMEDPFLEAMGNSLDELDPDAAEEPVKSLEQRLGLEQELSDSDLRLDEDSGLDALASVPQSDRGATAANDLDLLEDVEGSDPELLEIFLEEAQELGEGMDAALQGWQAQQDSDSLNQLKRLLHTLKGASRLAGVIQIGDLSHAYESLFMAIEQGRLPVDDPLLGLIRQVGDHLLAQIDALATTGKVPSSQRLIEALEVAQRGER